MLEKKIMKNINLIKKIVKKSNKVKEKEKKIQTELKVIFLNISLRNKRTLKIKSKKYIS